MRKMTGLALLVTARRPVWRAQEAPPAPTRESAATLVVYHDFCPVDLAAVLRKTPRHPARSHCRPQLPGNRGDQPSPIRRNDRGPAAEDFCRPGMVGRLAGQPEPSGLGRSGSAFVALMRGIPLKMANRPTYPGGRLTRKTAGARSPTRRPWTPTRDARVRTRKISGPMKNLTIELYAILMDARAGGDHARVPAGRPDGGDGAGHDRRGDFRRARGLFGYVDLRGITNRSLVDKWLATAAVELRHTECRSYGCSSPEFFCFRRFSDGSRHNYLGWYAQIFRRPSRWRGSFPVRTGGHGGNLHIHSFSAATLRDPKVGRAAARARRARRHFGNVYEPYFALTPNLDIFVDRLRNGFHLRGNRLCVRAGFSRG